MTRDTHEVILRPGDVHRAHGVLQPPIFALLLGCGIYPMLSQQLFEILDPGDESRDLLTRERLAVVFPGFPAAFVLTLDRVEKSWTYLVDLAGSTLWLHTVTLDSPAQIRGICPATHLRLQFSHALEVFVRLFLTMRRGSWEEPGLGPPLGPDDACVWDLWGRDKTGQEEGST
jgi:hypothetical protein